MPRFEIYNECTGEVLGTFAAENETAALDVMALAYGFADYAAVCRDAGCSVEDGRAELQITREG